MDNQELAKKILETPNEGVYETMHGRIKEDGTMEIHRVFSGNNKQKKIEDQHLVYMSDEMYTPFTIRE